MSSDDLPPSFTPKRRGKLAEINPFPSIFHLGPADRDHEVAIRCAITISLPLFALWLIDRIDLSVFATFSTFPALYGRNLPHGARLRMQMHAGVLMLVTLMLAVLAARLVVGCDNGVWWLAAATAAVAGGLTAMAQYWQLRPGGALFFVFAFGAVATTPHQPPVLDATITAFTVVAWALLMGMSSRLLGRRFWKPFEWPSGPIFGGDSASLVPSLVLLNALAAACAGMLALGLSKSWEIQHTYWAQIAAVVPLAGHPTRMAVNRGLHRIIGTFLGLFIAAMVMHAHPPLWLLIVLVAIFQGLTELVIARSYLLGLVFVTPLALLSVTLATLGTGGSVHVNSLLHNRGIETFIGASVGIAFALIRWAIQRQRLK